MITVKTHPAFDTWLGGLKDKATVIRLRARLKKATLGNLGDVAPVGSGVSEMREHFGPGWRMYFTQRGNTIIVMLGGGAKSKQAADIAKAIHLASTLEE
jgi:putative addiction module killer protein